MSTDVRILPDQRNAAIDALRPHLCSIDYHPPASGPEIEITVVEVDEAAVRATLEAANVTILAIRTRALTLAERETAPPSGLLARVRRAMRM